MRTSHVIGACLLFLIAGPSVVDAQVNTTVETFRVPSNGSPVKAKTRIKPRKIYEIIADGRYFDDVVFGILSDAEYDDISLANPLDRCGGGLDDAGIGINSVPVVYGGQGKTNRWGAFNGANRYRVTYWIGKGDSSQLSFRVHDCNYDDNQDDFSDPLIIEIRAPQLGNCDVIPEVFHIVDSQYSTEDGALWEVKVLGNILDTSGSGVYLCVDGRALELNSAILSAVSTAGPASFKEKKPNPLFSDCTDNVLPDGSVLTQCQLLFPYGKRRKFDITSADGKYTTTVTLNPINPYK